MSEASEAWKRLKELISRYNTSLKRQASNSPQEEQSQYLEMLVDAERVENKVNPGMPDVYFRRADGENTWVELKLEKETAKKATHSKGWRTHFFPEKIKLRKEQIIWHMNHAKLGQQSWIVLRYGNNFFVWSGNLAKDLAAGRMIDRNVSFSATSDKETPAFLAYIFGDKNWKDQYKIDL